jgi:hypothetical protein
MSDVTMTLPAISLPSGAVLLDITGDDARDLALVCSRHATEAISEGDRPAAEAFLLDAYTFAADAYPDGTSAALALAFTLGQVTAAFNAYWPVTS